MEYEADDDNSPPLDTTDKCYEADTFAGWSVRCELGWDDPDDDDKEKGDDATGGGGSTNEALRERLPRRMVRMTPPGASRRTARDR